jgi:6-phosphofructokinase
MSKKIGILTAGGDTPGLNAAMRGLGKSARSFDMELIGFYQGFRGLMENKTLKLDQKTLSGILTLGGTILGTSRDKPQKMLIDGKEQDMTDIMVEHYHKNKLDALVCLGGGGTQKNAYHLYQQGLNIITLPKTIDNDIVGTDISFGYDTALGIATEAIDRLHSTAHSHHRIIVVEIMGHRAGWLALGAGVAGGADVILIPEIPYDVRLVASAIKKRSKEGKHFSIVAVAEGALSKEDHLVYEGLVKLVDDAGKGEPKRQAKQALLNFELGLRGHTLRLATQLEELTGLESRLTILGHLQRGGTPSAQDRVLATRLGTACPHYIEEKQFGNMVAIRGEDTCLVPLKDVVGIKKAVPLNHPLVQSARRVGTCLGDDDSI